MSHWRQVGRTILIGVVGVLVGHLVLYGISWLLVRYHVLHPLPPGKEVHGHRPFNWPLLGAVIGATICWIALFWALNRMPMSAKKRLIVAWTFLTGLFYPLSYFLPAKAVIFWWTKGHVNPLPGWEASVGDAMQVIFAFTFALGAINLAMVHGKTLGRLSRGWINSLAFFLAFIAMAVFGLWQNVVPSRALDLSEMGVLGPHIGQFVHKAYDYLWDGLYIPLDTAIFSILAFYIGSAAFRAFRVRSTEAALMMAAAFLVMLGTVPLGMWVTSGIPSEGFFGGLRVERMAHWLLMVPNMAGSRAISFGLAVGALAMSLRIWLNLERGAFFDQEL